MSLESKDYLTAAEAAEIIGVTPRQVRRLCKDKKLTSRLFAPGAYIVQRDSAEAYKDTVSARYKVKLCKG